MQNETQSENRRCSSSTKFKGLRRFVACRQQWSRFCFYAALLPRRGRILRRTLSVCPSVCPSRYRCQRHVAPPSELQWHTCTFRQALTGRISYGHLGRTSLLFGWLNGVETPYGRHGEYRNTFCSSILRTTFPHARYLYGISVCRYASVRPSIRTLVV